MKLACKNLAVNAACMVLSGHTKMDLAYLDESACLLTVDSKSFPPCIAFNHREGCYLYYDRNLGAFVRSGKVTRRGFVVQDDEHVKGAMASSANSHFYFVYPSKHSSRADKRDKQGLFENLIQLIGAGFDPTADSAKVLEKGHDEGGLLILNAEDKENIKRSIGKDLASIQKFQDFVAYQFQSGSKFSLVFLELKVSHLGS